MLTRDQEFIVEPSASKGMRRTRPPRESTSSSTERAPHPRTRRGSPPAACPPASVCPATSARNWVRSVARNRKAHGQPRACLASPFWSCSRGGASRLEPGASAGHALEAAVTHPPVLRLGPGSSRGPRSPPEPTAHSPEWVGGPYLHLGGQCALLHEVLDQRLASRLLQVAVVRHGADHLHHRPLHLRRAEQGAASDARRPDGLAWGPESNPFLCLRLCL